MPTVLSCREKQCPWLGLLQEFEGQAVSALAILQAQDLGGAVPEAGKSMHSQGIHPAPPQSPSLAQEVDWGRAPRHPLLTRCGMCAACWQMPPDQTRCHR